VSGYEFIFSDKVKYRLARHLTFWLLFCLQTIVVALRMDSISGFLDYQTYEPPLFFLCSVLPVCIFSVYTSTYLLFPLLQRKRYAVFSYGITCLVIFNCVAALFLYVIMRPYICPECEAIDVREKINMMGTNGINTASFMALVGLGIKFTKNWYQQQIRNRILARQKMGNELRLLKKRIQPSFLFDTLQALYQTITSDKNQAAKMLLEFSDLLSYTLYECDKDFISLAKELIVIKEFILLEKTIWEPGLIIVYDATGDAQEKGIPSFILLSLIQNCVISLHTNANKNPHYISIKTDIENSALHCNINIQPGDTAVNKDVYLLIIDTFINRLDTFYSNNYKLEFSEQAADKFSIILSLLLPGNLPPVKEEKVPEIKYTYAPA
jgi:sensor histidine kinase YesM